MEIQLSLSAAQGSGAVSASEIAEVAMTILPKVKAKLQGKISDRSLKLVVADAVARWVKASNKAYDSTQRTAMGKRLTTRVLALLKKGPARSPVKAPADKVVPVTKAATKDEKLKAQLLAGTKLRNQFQSMLTKKPALTGKSIENLRKHCDAYSKVIDSVQKGNEGLAEVTKIEGLRGIDSVKNYVNSVMGLTFGFVEIARHLGVNQSVLGEKISKGIDIESMTKVMQKQRAKENAQKSLSYAVKALQKKGCSLPAAFTREVEKVFVDAAQSGDYKSAKARIKELVDGLVSDVFNNKVKLFQTK